MKKTRLFISSFLIISGLILLSAVVLAQGTEVPKDVSEIIADPVYWLSNLGSMAGLVIFLAAIVIRVFEITGDGWKQIIAMVTAIVLALLANFINIGMFQALEFWPSVAHGVGAGLIAMGLVSVEKVRALLEFLQLKEKT